METKHTKIKHDNSKINSAKEKLEYRKPDIDVMAASMVLKFGLSLGTDANGSGQAVGPNS